MTSTFASHPVSCLVGAGVRRSESLKDLRFISSSYFYEKVGSQFKHWTCEDPEAPFTILSLTSHYDVMGLTVHIFIVVQSWLHVILARFLSLALLTTVFTVLLGIYIVFDMNTKPFSWHNLLTTSTPLEIPVYSGKDRKEIFSETVLCSCDLSLGVKSWASQMLCHHTMGLFPWNAKS